MSGIRGHLIGQFKQLLLSLAVKQPTNPMLLGLPSSKRNGYNSVDPLT